MMPYVKFIYSPPVKPTMNNYFQKEAPLWGVVFMMSGQADWEEVCREDFTFRPVCHVTRLITFVTYIFLSGRCWSSFHVLAYTHTCTHNRGLKPHFGLLLAFPENSLPEGSDLGSLLKL